MILVKMNFTAGTFLISRFKVVCVVSPEGVKIVAFKRVAAPCFRQLDFKFKTYVVSRFGGHNLYSINMTKL